MKRLMMMAVMVGAALPIAASAQPAHDGGRMFDMMEGNGDGKLDKAEITKMAQMRAERQGDASLASPERVDAFFKHLDANGDGFIDKGEMESMRKARAAPPPQDEPENAPDEAN